MRDERIPTAATVNAISPYFTMFPLRFPWSILRSRAANKDIILDPFCGRGTTNLAARLLGLRSIGIDTSPVAIAATEAKLASPSPSAAAIVNEARTILSCADVSDVPMGEFWSLAYHPEVLSGVCQLRRALNLDCETPVRKALRGIVLGALHGPLSKNGKTSYFSNQCPRTYAPKPDYAVQYWHKFGSGAPKIEIIDVIEKRALRYFSEGLPVTANYVTLGDSRDRFVFANIGQFCDPNWIITSPPYYGLRTYVPDQWLRNWFLGGPERVDYSYSIQLSHRNVEAFIGDLHSVWYNIDNIASLGARLVFRFGAINDRHVNPQDIIRSSLDGTRWRLQTIKCAGTANSGKRQARSFGGDSAPPVTELDAWAIRN